LDFGEFVIFAIFPRLANSKKFLNIKWRCTSVNMVEEMLCDELILPLSMVERIIEALGE
jgi:hypothetical protein